MPVIDMPREELEKYMGITPKPKDFDEFWNDGLSLLDDVSATIEVHDTGLSFACGKCYDLYYEGVGGARVYAKYIKASTSSAPALLYFHGYRRSSPSWSFLLQFAAMGFSVFAMDCRGQGGKSEDVGGVKGTTFIGSIIRGLDDSNPHKMLMHQIMLDAVELSRIAVLFGCQGIVTYGASQGGGLSLATAALAGESVIKVIAMLPFLCDYKRAYQMDFEDSAYSELKYYFRQFDPKHEHEDRTFQLLGYMDVKNLASRIKSETLMITGLEDTVCPPSTQFAAYNNINAKKTMILYPDYAHEIATDMEDQAIRFMIGAVG